MFDLEKNEKFIVIFLVFTLLLGLGVAAYKRSNPSPIMEIKNFSVEKEKININEAEVPDFMKLAGVGRALAGRIVDYRTNQGRFSSIEDMKKVKGVGDKLFEKIKNDISVE